MSEVKKQERKIINELTENSNVKLYEERLKILYRKIQKKSDDHNKNLMDFYLTYNEKLAYEFDLLKNTDIDFHAFLAMHLADLKLKCKKENKWTYLNKFFNQSITIIVVMIPILITLLSSFLYKLLDIHLDQFSLEQLKELLNTFNDNLFKNVGMIFLGIFVIVALINSALYSLGNGRSTYYSFVISYISSELENELRKK